MDSFVELKSSSRRGVKQKISRSSASTTQKKMKIDSDEGEIEEQQLQRQLEQEDKEIIRPGQSTYDNKLRDDEEESTNVAAVVSSVEEEEYGEEVKSIYQVRPARGIFHDAAMLKSFIDDVVGSLDDSKATPILSKPSDVRSLRVSLNKVPKKAAHYTQYTYKISIRLGIVANLYGAFVNTMEQFSERQKIFDMQHLEPKHRVSMLVCAVNYWWDERSKLLMKSLFDDKLKHDLTSIVNKDDFVEAVSKFKIDPMVAWKKLKDKILSAKKVNNITGNMTPGVWNIKIKNTQTIPSRISVPLMEFKESQKSCVSGKWKRLVLEPKYIHGFAVISISGFKITRTGLSLDTDLEFLAYNNIPTELQLSEKATAQQEQQKNIIKKMSKWIVTTANDSSDDEDNIAAAKTSKFVFE